jgi:hypothetical protein
VLVEHVALLEAEPHGRKGQASTQALGDLTLDSSVHEALPEELRQRVQKVVDVMVEGTTAETGQDRMAARHQLERLWRLSADRLIDNLGNPNVTIVEAAAKSLILMRNERVVRDIIEMVRSTEDERARSLGVFTLGKMMEQRKTIVKNRECLSPEESARLAREIIIPFLEGLAQTEESQRVRRAIGRSLRELKEAVEGAAAGESGQRDSPGDNDALRRRSTRFPGAPDRASRAEEGARTRDGSSNGPREQADTSRGLRPAASPEGPGPQRPARPVGDAGKKIDRTADDRGKADKQLLEELEAHCKSGDIDGVEKIVDILETRSSLDYFRWLSRARHNELHPGFPRKDEVLGVLRRSAASVFQRGMDVPPQTRKRLLDSWLRVDEESTKTGPEWEAERRESARLWLGVHEEITAMIDWDWKYEEPPVATGPETPAQREARVQEGCRIAVKNFRQHELRRSREENLRSVTDYIATIYSREPLAPAELDRLLSTVSDEELKQRILKEVARRTSAK